MLVPMWVGRQSGGRSLVGTGMVKGAGVCVRVHLLAARGRRKPPDQRTLFTPRFQATHRFLASKEPYSPQLERKLWLFCS